MQTPIIRYTKLMVTIKALQKVIGSLSLEHTMESCSAFCRSVFHIMESIVKYIMENSWAKHWTTNKYNGKLNKKNHCIIECSELFFKLYQNHNHIFVANSTHLTKLVLQDKISIWRRPLLKWALTRAALIMKYGIIHRTTCYQKPKYLTAVWKNSNLKK